jgi:ribose 1,5-bisphosphokinase
MSVLFLIIGNSGAGKDTIIKSIKENFPSKLYELKIPRRVVTRQASDTENFESVDAETFHKLRESGEFVFEWESYEHFYGIRKEILDWLRKGHPVMVNVSRKIINHAKQKFPNAKVIFIRVPLEITADRIIERGRESYEEVLNRVVRAQDHQDYEEADLVVNNVGKIMETSNKVLEFMLKTIKEQPKLIT